MTSSQNKYLDTALRALVAEHKKSHGFQDHVQYEGGGKDEEEKNQSINGSHDQLLELKP